MFCVLQLPKDLSTTAEVFVQWARIQGATGSSVDDSISGMFVVDSSMSTVIVVGDTSSVEVGLIVTVVVSTIVTKVSVIVDCCSGTGEEKMLDSIISSTISGLIDCSGTAEVDVVYSVKAVLK